MATQSVPVVDGNAPGRLNLNCNNNGNNRNGCAVRIALNPKTFHLSMKSYNNLYSDICDWKNLVLAWKKARKGKTRKIYVMEFEADLRNNLLKLQEELKNQIYKPKPLVNFIIKDPKTRKISKSAFSDRIVHHALFQTIEPIFDKGFIYDSCANRKGKGNLFALKRLDYFVRKVSRNGKIKGWFNENQIKGYALKADIKHYFEEVNHEILIEIIKRKITDEKVIWLIEQILLSTVSQFGGGERGLACVECHLET